jgi:stearoyl-CoA desaturase (delta-9 desaturase)
MANFLNNFNLKIKTLQLINLVSSVCFIAYFLLNHQFYYLIISFIAFLFFGIVGANVGLHRYFSHRSFKVSRPVEIFLAIISTLCSLGSIVSWAAIHRHHHLHSDTELDIHSPKYIGNFKSYFYIWKRSNISKRFIRTEMSDPVLVFLHKNYFKIIFVYITILAMIDPILIICLYAIPVTGCLNGVSAVTVFAHIFGYKNHEVKDDSRNNFIACLLSLGEGWHNNHHAAPYNWKQGERWWEFDPPSWVIRIIKK